MDGASFIMMFTGDAGPALRSIGEIDAALGGLEASSGSKLASIAKAGAAVGVALGAAAVGIGVWAVEGSAKLTTALTLIRTQAHDTVDTIDFLRGQVYKLAPEVGQGPDKLAEALYHITSVGYTGATAMDILHTAAQGAAVGNADLESTTNALVATIRSGIPGVHGAKDAMSQLNAIVGAGNMRMGDLNLAMRSGFQAAAQVFGVSLQSAGAALSYLTDRGVPAVVAATRLRMSMSLMGAPTHQASKLLESLGLTAQEAKDRTGAMAEILAKSGVTVTSLAADMRKPDGIQVALMDLKTHLTNAGLTAEQQAAVISRAFGGGRSGSAIMSMYGDLENLKQKYIQIGGAAGDFGKSWAITADTFTFKQHQAAAAVQVLRDKIGDALMPIAKALMGYFAGTVEPALGRAVDWFSKNLPGAIAIVMKWFSDHRKGLMDIVDTIKTGLLIALAGIVTVLNILVPIIGFIVDHFTAFRDVALAVVGVLVIMKIAFAIQALIQGVVIAMSAATAVMSGMATATEILSAATGSLAAAEFLAALPLMLIIAAIIGVIAVVVLLITHWKQVDHFIGEVGNHIRTFFIAAWHDLLKVLGNVKEFLNKLPGEIGGAIASLGGHIKQALNDAGAAIKNFAGDVWGHITGAFKRVIDWLGTELPKIPGQIFDAFFISIGHIGRFAVDLWHFLTVDVSKWVDGVIAWFQKLPQRMGDEFLKMRNHLGGMKDALWHFLSVDVSKWVDGVIDWFRKLPQRAGDEWMKIKNHLGAMKDALWHFLSVDVSGWVDGVIGWFKKLPQRAGDEWKKITDDLGGLKDRLWHWASVDVSQWVDRVIASIAALPGKMQTAGNDAVDGFIQGAVKKAEDLWKWIEHLWQRAIDDIKKGFGSHSPSTKMAEIGKDLILGLLNGLIGMVGRLWDWWRNLVHDTLAKFDGAVGWLVDKGHQILDGLLNGLSNAWGGIQRFVQSIPSSVLNLIGNVGSLLFNAGHSILSGLLNGLKSAWNDVSGFVSGIASKIASLKGPLPYDRQLLIPHGNAIMQGLHQGLSDGYSAVQDLVASMADGINIPITSSGGLAGAGAGAGGGAGGMMGGTRIGDINVYNPQNATGVAEAVATRIRLQQMQQRGQMPSPNERVA